LFDVTVFKQLLYPISLDMAAFNLTGQGMKRNAPFGFAQGREHVERQMDFLRSRQA